MDMLQHVHILIHTTHTESARKYNERMKRYNNDPGDCRLCTAIGANAARHRSGEDIDMYIPTYCIIITGSFTSPMFYLDLRRLVFESRARNARNRNTTIKTKRQIISVQKCS